MNVMLPVKVITEVNKKLLLIWPKKSQLKLMITVEFS